jgi:tRNA nucleotidyltransferase (CCA-adding enzyme)
MTLVIRTPEMGPPPKSSLTFEEELLKAMRVPLNVKLYLVGGAVREIVRGFPEKVKDWDFAVEANSYESMKIWLEYTGFEIFVETPQYFTIRARAPKGTFTFAGIDMTHKTFDFTLCRTEGEYTDGRRPDEVRVGTLADDLSRRDFTMNAMALDAAGGLIDPYNGAEDVKNGLIRLVGGTDRLKEDSLRMLRALRFQIQLGFDMDNEIHAFLYNANNSVLLRKIDENRIRDELTKCFKMNTPETLMLLQVYFAIRDVIFEETDIWLQPTVKGIKRD